MVRSNCVVISMKDVSPMLMRYTILIIGTNRGANIPIILISYMSCDLPAIAAFSLTPLERSDQYWSAVIEEAFRNSILLDMPNFGEVRL